MAHTSSCSSARESPESCSAACRRRPGVVHDHDARAQRAVGGTIVFTLLALFARQRRDALAALREEQAKAESLLLNILPQSIAERLKAETQTIADQFSSASILFADVVDFTPLAERLPPAEVVGMLDRPVQPLRRACRAAWAREDQDDRRLLHGRRRRPHTAARPCPRPRPDGARHAGGDALGRRGRASRARAARRDQLGTGRRRRDRPEAVPLRPLGRRGEHRESHGVARHAGPNPDHPSRRRSCSRTSSCASRGGRSRSRARARWRPGTSSVAG